ncbi:C39 family peptidase [Pontiella desulfatans]|nr:C39 family peptidase [Pontiella desulfatans]
MASATTAPVFITGTSSNDTLYGTAGNDCIDGLEGGDVMIGLGGDDYYYVDHEQDTVVENPDEGFDTVELKFCFWTNMNGWLNSEIYSIPTNVEKVVMGQDAFDVVEFASNTLAHVYGDPIDWRDRLDDNQFDNASNLVNTCTMASIANVMTMLGEVITEEEVIAYMYANDLVGNRARGDTDPANVAVALESGYGCEVSLLTNRPMPEVAEYLESGKAIILGVDYGVVNVNASPRGYDDHAITLTGVAYNEMTGELEGFYYCDSGDETNPSGASFMSTSLYHEAHGQYVPDGNYPGAQIVVVDFPLKIQRDSFRVEGSVGGSPAIIGNSGDNVIWTTDGNDYAEGGKGNDVFHDETGGNDVFLPGEGNDVVHSFSGADSFVFSEGGGIDEVIDTDADLDELVFDASVDKAGMVLGLDGSDLWVAYGSNDRVRVSGYDNGYGFSIRMADGTALEPSALSNLVAQMEAYCGTNGIDFSDPAAVQADSNLVAMIQGGWRQDTNAINYQAWIAMHAVGHASSGYAQAPAGDGVGNLLKYAAGFSPFVPVAASNLFTFAGDSSTGRFKMVYAQSRRANASLVPEWSASLTNGWQAGGIQTIILNETSTNELREASVPLGQTGFMRLRAVLEE